jgi:hypothetical protein
LNAKWIVVVDGQVLMHGSTLDSYPEDEDFFALCEKTGRFPFVFISPRVFDIEERPTVWHKTKWLELIDEVGTSHKWRTAIICVANWKRSPFTSINPSRTFLLGRGVLFNLRPRITPDFDARLTEVKFKATAA